MRTVFLVPRRKDGGHRDALWEWCRERWEALLPDVPIVEGHHDDGPFNRSAAINTAAGLAGDWDLGIVIDSDVLLPISQVGAAIETAQRTGNVTWAHRRWRGLHEDWTRQVLRRKVDYFGPECDRTDIDLLVERTNPLSWSCCFVIPRVVWDEVGGFDERFVGWGFEDMAWQSVIAGLHGFERIDGDVLHLWHPRSEDRIVKGEPSSTASAAYIANGRLGRRYMYALRRDYGLTERVALAGPEELARDLRNLERDDEKFARMQPKAEREKWAGWWPTLDELVAGAREYIEANRLGTVTVIVHTGGDPANWPERRVYLERSLPSLAERVSGPIVQRVVYDCWGEPDIRAELEGLARPFGFYVVGPVELAGLHRLDGCDVALPRQAGARDVHPPGRGRLHLRARRGPGADDGDAARQPAPRPDRPAARRLLPRRARDRRHPRLARAGLHAHRGERLHGWSTNLFWTNNPSLFRRSLTEHAVAARSPLGDAVRNVLFGRDPMARSAFWGTGEEWIRHIGEVRAGAGY